jgi:hypothetical protein
VAEAIARTDPRSPEAELAVLAALTARRPAGAPEARAEPLAPGLALESRLSGRRLTLTLKGEGVSPELRDRLHAMLRDWGAGDSRG